MDATTLDADLATGAISAPTDGDGARIATNPARHNRWTAPNDAEALDIGADDYLRKPFSFVVLLARLRALARRGALAHLADFDEEPVGRLPDDYMARLTRSVVVFLGLATSRSTALGPREFETLDAIGVWYPGACEE